MNNSVLITIIVALIVGAGAFYGGMKYQQSKRAATFTRQFGTGQGQNGAGNQQNRFRAGGGQVFGDIISKDDKSITVKLADGSSKIVLFSDTTAINRASQGTKDDLKEGEKVVVFGNANSDGSVTAQNIQLNPTFRGTGGTTPTQ